MKLVKAWNGKWHIHEADLRVNPAIPKRFIVCDGKTTTWPSSSPWLRGRTSPCDNIREKMPFERELPNCWVCRRGGKVRALPLPQPERQVALTVCGEEVYVRKAADVTNMDQFRELIGPNKAWGYNRRRCEKCPIERRLSY